MKDDTQLFYDLTAEETAEKWYENNILMPTIKDFMALLPENPRILDFGCGPGHESMRLASMGAEVVGIDFSSECIRIARQRCPQCRFEVMNFYTLDKTLGIFDGIFASGSLIHAENDKIEAVIKDVAELLRNKGCFLMIAQKGHGVKEKQSTLEIKGKSLRRPVYCYTKDFVVDISRSAELQFLKEGYLDKSLIAQEWRNYIFTKISKADR
ncbi:MAG: class I SAM-dependent methyltransferase [Candidatus Ratteibacteria bacterium]|jgi:2-polyprenyl-3-methyl-5-hydroxy-6-metoxy-1,4-benzoquinol methylase